MPHSTMHLPRRESGAGIDCMFSIYIRHAPRTPTDKGAWIEPVQVYAQEYAIVRMSSVSIT
jgi:hypothetical protein